MQNPNYRGISAQFWRNLKMVGDRETVQLHGHAQLRQGRAEPDHARRARHARRLSSRTSTSSEGSRPWQANDVRHAHEDARDADARGLPCTNSPITTMSRAARGDEVALLTFSGEDSDFVRFNTDAVRQAGAVTQQRPLDRSDPTASATPRRGFTLTGDPATDRSARRGDDRGAARTPAASARGSAPALRRPRSTRPRQHGDEQARRRPRRRWRRSSSAARARTRSGSTPRGRSIAASPTPSASATGSPAYTFNLDWSFYLHGDKAVKARYAGFDWDDAELRRHMDDAAPAARDPRQRAQDDRAGQVPRLPGAAGALNEVIGLLSWGGFGLKAHRTKISSLLRMVEGEATLHPGGHDSREHGRRRRAELPRRGLHQARPRST